MEYVYLIHFSRPIGDPNNPRGQAQHYLGYTEDLEERLARHRAGNGAAIMAFLAQEGIEWECVRVWETEDGRALEKQLKRGHNHSRLCPICRGDHGKA